ncbi:hypothetical protein GCM10010358_60610 [Streptomyces minutiscleroticus]|uniref:Uncharacterized protein n=1 Tax=Streptomyces minutiscleroticus TaxID=68238 RepID=A0A918NVQ2_9ACTN|nr:hypothetical protein [Streptomyces minutiscleroticus]GGX98819.1 hypothetical protein GCM10010358_60610 [Streptomyces minutiscleroticus]
MTRHVTQVAQIAHTVAGGDPAGLGLALEVARELHPPAGRAPEVAPPALPRSVRRSAARRRAARPRRGRTPPTAIVRG